MPKFFTMEPHFDKIPCENCGGEGRIEQGNGHGGFERISCPQCPGGGVQFIPNYQKKYVELDDSKEYEISYNYFRKPIRRLNERRTNNR